MISSAIIGSLPSFVSGLLGLAKEKKARKREATATIMDLARMQAQEEQNYAQDVSMAYDTAASGLAAGNVKSAYLPKMQEQTMQRGLSNIRQGYGQQKQAVRWFRGR